MIRRVGRFFAAIAVAVGAVVVFAAPALAHDEQVTSGWAVLADGDPNDFTFSSLDIDYTLSRDADGVAQLHVVETFVADFPEFDQNRGLMRAVPRFGDRINMHPEFISVTDEFGAPRPVEVTSDSDFLTLVSRSDTYLHGEQTFVITYTLDNVVKRFADNDRDEFYWDTTGFETPQEIKQFTARVNLDADIVAAATNDARCYWGGAGSTDECLIAGNAETGWEASVTGLQPFQNVTLAIGFETGTFTVAERPTSWTDAVPAIHTGLLAGVGGAVGGAFLLRRTVLKDSPGHPTVVAQYEPPAGVDALAAAVMLKKQAAAIPAEILEQAVRGSVQLVQASKSSVSVRLVDPRRAGDRDGAELLHAMFGPKAQPGKEYRLAGGYDARFAKLANAILVGVKREQVQGGVWRPVRNPLVTVVKVLAVILGIVLFFTAPIAAIGYESPLGILLGGVGVIGAAITFALVRKKPYSEIGANLRDHLAGLKLFMQWAEADRIRMLQSVQGAERAPIDAADPRQRLLIYEPLLPYAVVFGIEKSWARELEVTFEQASMQPTWVVSPYGFSPSLVTAMTASTASAMTSPASSSSSGGSTGGGFSGGGMGGGRIGGV